MTSGELDRRVTFLRRPLIEADAAGEERGKFKPEFEVWAAFTPMSSQRRADYGYAEDVLSGWLKIRESLKVATLTISDRVVLKGDGDEFAIDSVPVNDRSGYRLLRVSRKLG